MPRQLLNRAPAWFIHHRNRPKARSGPRLHLPLPTLLLLRTPDHHLVCGAMTPAKIPVVLAITPKCQTVPHYLPINSIFLVAPRHLSIPQPSIIDMNLNLLSLAKVVEDSFLHSSYLVGFPWLLLSFLIFFFLFTSPIFCFHFLTFILFLFPLPFFFRVRPVL